jgi:hypothetical protein
MSCNATILSGFANNKSFIVNALVVKSDNTDVGSMAPGFAKV